jgi:hypothetical protein
MLLASFSTGVVKVSFSFTEGAGVEATDVTTEETLTLR